MTDSYGTMRELFLVRNNDIAGRFQLKFGGFTWSVQAMTKSHETII